MTLPMPRSQGAPAEANSLWRSGKIKTMASWILESPASGAPKLRVLIANPDEAETLQEFVLDKTFWKR